MKTLVTFAHYTGYGANLRKTRGTSKSVLIFGECTQKEALKIALDALRAKGEYIYGLNSLYSGYMAFFRNYRSGKLPKNTLEIIKL